MKFRNLTPNKLIILKGNDELMALEPDGDVASVEAKTDAAGELDGVELFTTTFGAIEGLPEKEDGVFLITSTLVAQAAAKLGRDDVFSPGELIRNGFNQPIGYKGLVKW